MEFNSNGSYDQFLDIVGFLRFVSCQAEVVFQQGVEQKLGCVRIMLGVGNVGWIDPAGDVKADFQLVLPEAGSARRP